MADYGGFFRPTFNTSRSADILYPTDPESFTHRSEIAELVNLTPRGSLSFYDTRTGWRFAAFWFHAWMVYYRGKMNDIYDVYADTADALVGANNEIAQRDITIGDLATQIGDFTTQIGDLTTLINSLSTDNTETREQRDEAIAQRDGLQGQLGELQAQHDELQGGYNEAITQRNELQGDYDTALNDLRDTTEQLGDVQDTVGTYENKWREDNPDLADKGLDFPTFIDLTDAFASEDPEKIGSAIGTLEGMGINPADIKGERFKFGEGEDEKEYIPTDPPEIPGLFDPEYPEFEKEAEEFLKDEERKTALFDEFDKYKATVADDNATEPDKSGALSSLVEKAGPLGALIPSFLSVGSAVAGFLQPGDGDGETPGGEPVTDYRLPKITRKIPDLNLGLDIPISDKSLVNLSGGGFIKKPVPPPAPETFLTTEVRPGEKIPEFELKYEDKPYVGLLPKKEDKEGNYLQYPSFGKDKLKYPETALLETDLSEAALL